MDDTIDVSIPVAADAARQLESSARREAVGRFVSGLLREGRLRDLLADAIADAKREARAQGLTDADVDAELETWRAERGLDRRF